MTEMPTEIAPAPGPSDIAGIATAEGGFVILDGLPGVSATLTPDAALRTAQQLIAAAEQARQQR